MAEICGLRIYQKKAPSESKPVSSYTKAENLGARLADAERGIYALPMGATCSVTVKIDGTQLWLRWQIKEDGSLKLAFIKSHGGNTQGAKISPNGWNTPQAVLDSELTFQGGSIYQTLGDPALWDAIKTVMNALNVTEMDTYCEHTFTPDKKTPCDLDYSSEPELYDRLFIFEFVWMKDGDKYAISHTHESNQNPWWEVIAPWMIPLVDELSGQPLTLDTLNAIFAWLEKHSYHEGLMLLVGNSITKIKLHHAKDFLPDMEETNAWLPTEEQLPLKQFLLNVHQLFLEVLKRNNINLEQKPDAVPCDEKKKKEKKEKPPPEGGWIEFSDGKVREEINKALTHENWDSLFSELRNIGKINTKKALNELYRVVGTTKITHNNTEITLMSMVINGLLEDYNKGVKTSLTAKNFSKTYMRMLSELLYKIVREKLSEQ